MSLETKTVVKDIAWAIFFGVLVVMISFLLGFLVTLFVVIDSGCCP